MENIYDEIDGVRHDVRQVSSAQDDLRRSHDELAAQVREIREQQQGGGEATNVGLLRPPTGDRDRGGDYVPDEVRVQGFCPYQCPRREQLGQQSYKETGGIFSRLLPSALRGVVTLMPPGPNNFRLVFRVVGGRANCDATCMALRTIVERESIKILGKTPTVSVKPSPERRQVYTTFFNAKRLVLQNVEEDLLEFDQRTLSILEKASLEEVGHLAHDGTWQWAPESVRPHRLQHQR